jgi:hypothetical protein
MLVVSKLEHDIGFRSGGRVLLTPGDNVLEGMLHDTELALIEALAKDGHVEILEPYVEPTKQPFRAVEPSSVHSPEEMHENADPAEAEARETDDVESATHPVATSDPGPTPTPAAAASHSQKPPKPQQRGLRKATHGP